MFYPNNMGFGIKPWISDQEAWCDKPQNGHHIPLIGKIWFKASWMAYVEPKSHMLWSKTLDIHLGT